MHFLAKERVPAFCQVLTVIPAIIAPSLSVSLLAMLENLPVAIQMMPQSSVQLHVSGVCTYMYMKNHNCSGLPMVCMSGSSQSSYALMRANQPETAVA